MSARSFTLTAALPEDITRSLAEARGHVASPAGGLVFLSGALAQSAARVAEYVRVAWKGVPACVIPAAGVITERGETESTSAMSGILWAGGRAATFSSSSDDSDDDQLGRDELRAADPSPTLASSLEAAAIAAGKPRSATAIVFARSEALRDEILDGFAGAAAKVCVLGAGTTSGRAITVDPGGRITRGELAGLLISGLATPIVESTPACRLLSPFLPIEEASGGFVLRVGGRSALDFLSSLTNEMGRDAATQGAPQGRSAPIVFAAIADGEAVNEGEDRYTVRPVRGVDPARGGVLIGREARVGARFTFGVRDAGAARAGLESAARAVATAALGSAPRFAIYLSCAGRGEALYGAPDVESRILRQRFGDLPIAGMHSSFELTPWAHGAARLALYTGVLALFRSPS